MGLLRGRSLSVSQLSFILCLCIMMFHISCSEDRVNVRHEVNVNLSADPETLHPHYHISIPAIHICKHIFQPLLDFDYESGKIIPVLAEELPEVVENDNGTISYFFKIRKGAKWEDDIDITSDDVIFSFKLLKNPIESNHHLNTTFDQLIEVKEVKNKPREVEIVFEGNFQNADLILTNLLIIPALIYDPNRILERLSFEKLAERPIKENTGYLLNRFSKIFGNPFYHDNPKYISGSGPYIIESWEHDKKVVLKRKAEWYGDEITDNVFFQNDVDRINYLINESNDQAISKLLLGEIDVLAGLDAENIEKLSSSKFFKDNYEVHSPTRYSFTFLGMHLKNPLLKSLKVRKAIAHSMDKKMMIETILGGYGEVSVGPIPNSSKIDSQAIHDYQFNIKKAKQYLKEDGWSDVNYDGFLERVKDGKDEQLVFHLSYVKNKSARKIAEFVQVSLRSIGIRIILMELDFDTFLELNKRHKFDLCLSNFQTYPSRIDPKNVWHSESYEYGTNWMGFGNEVSDLLIKQIRSEKDLVKLKEYEQELEKVIHESLPCIFLFSPKHKIILSKNIEHAQFSSFGLGFWESNFKK